MSTATAEHAANREVCRWCAPRLAETPLGFCARCELSDVPNSVFVECIAHALRTVEGRSFRGPKKLRRFLMH